MKERLKRVTMENLPVSQARLELDDLATSVFLDTQALLPDATLFDIFSVIKELNEQQDLFIFQNGDVCATAKGIGSWV